MNVIEIIRFKGSAEALKDTFKALKESGDLDKVRAEKGCFYFDFFFSPEHEDEMLLAEKWESEEALDRHHGTEMMASLLALIKENELKLSVEKYEV